MKSLGVLDSLGKISGPVLSLSTGSMSKARLPLDKVLFGLHDTVPAHLHLWVSLFAFFAAGVWGTTYDSAPLQCLSRFNFLEC